MDGVVACPNDLNFGEAVLEDKVALCEVWCTIDEGE